MGRSGGVGVLMGVGVGVGGFELVLVVLVVVVVVEGELAPRTGWCMVVCRFLLLSYG